MYVQDDQEDEENNDIQYSQYAEEQVENKSLADGDEEVQGGEEKEELMMMARWQGTCAGWTRVGDWIEMGNKRRADSRT